MRIDQQYKRLWGFRDDGSHKSVLNRVNIYYHQYITYIIGKESIFIMRYKSVRFCAPQHNRMSITERKRERHKTHRVPIKFESLVVINKYKWTHYVDLSKDIVVEHDRRFF